MLCHRIEVIPVRLDVLGCTVTSNFLARIPGSGLEEGTSCSSDSETSYDKAELQHVERSAWVVTGMQII